MTTVEACDGRRAFCARLKSERERRGTSLAEIAASTKIKASLLEALERGDLSRWPKGLYQRAFFREYVAAIGLSPDDIASEFAELFADGESPRTASATTAPVHAVSETLPKGVPEAALKSGAPKSTETLRLLLGPVPAPPFGRAHDVATRLVFAVADVSILLLLALVVSAVSRLALMQAALLLGVATYLVMAAIGESPSLWLVTRARRVRQAAPAEHVHVPFMPGALPFQVDASSSPVLTFTDRFTEVLASGRALLHDRIERLSVFELTSSSRRRRDLASVRRQRAEAANRAGDELVI